ncbi:hypothetical protein [Acinetobacter baumannii]|nr:hypothetical protein [Acinetobacter baumannii]
MTIQDIQSLAEAHGLLLTDKMNFNEMALLQIVGGDKLIIPFC